MHRLSTGKRVLITQGEDCMGPVLREVLAGQGATMTASAQVRAAPDAAQPVVEEVGVSGVRRLGDALTVG